MGRTDDLRTWSEGDAPPVPLVRKLLWAALFLLIGLGAATYLHWPALTDPLTYKSDVRQSPHWAAYHTDSFRDDDLILTLARHNESPVQNLVYWLGTFVVDMVLLGKLLAVVGYGLTAALFCWVGQSLYGVRTGAIAALAFTFLPNQFEYSAGGFSKAWMLPVLLAVLVILERRAWRWLLPLMPFAAAAYPVTAVLTGAIVLAFLLLETCTHGLRAMWPGWRALVIASALAVAVLFVKYLFPPDGIGALTSSAVLREMPEMYRGGMWDYLPLPTLTQEMTEHLAHAFVLLSAIVFLVVLGRARAWWSRPMTAFVVASVVFYLLAYVFFMHLYQPNRYTRYSMIVVLAFWHARNWDRVLDRVPWRPVRVLAVAAIVGLGAYSYRGTFRAGMDTSSRAEWAALNEFLATLPDGVLVTGHPMAMDDVPILARRSVLCNYKLAHPWYSTYYPEIRRRTEATFDALYASDAATVDRLADEWGVTHLVVVRRFMKRIPMLRGNVYVAPYAERIAERAQRRERFLLDDPPPDRVVYADDELFVVALPLEPLAPSSGDGPDDTVADPPGDGDGQALPRR